MITHTLSCQMAISSILELHNFPLTYPFDAIFRGLNNLSIRLSLVSDPFATAKLDYRAVRSQLVTYVHVLEGLFRYDERKERKMSDKGGGRKDTMRPGSEIDIENPFRPYIDLNNLFTVRRRVQ